MTDKQTLKPAITIWNGPYKTWAETFSAAKTLNIAQPAFISKHWLQRTLSILLKKVPQ
tara:strand:+ start:329 stop:502 length:174 start_codon:yes stop_codon:yes gene_type:complete